MRKKSSARFDSDQWRHVEWAAVAASTARSMSWVDAKSTSPDCSPVAGLYTGPFRPDSPRMASPPIQWPIVRSSVVTAAAMSSSQLRLLVVVAYRGRQGGLDAGRDRSLQTRPGAKAATSE